MLRSGTTLRGDYVIERLLGQGGMGQVYLARQLSLGGRPVAIKALTVEGEDEATRAAAAAQFRREAQTLACIEHPNLADVKDFFEEGGADYLVMGFIDGVTLDHVVADNPMFLPCALVCEWGDAICEVLVFLHGQSPPVIVRDLKPGNLMIDVSGRIRLIDFGIARSGGAGTHTSTYLKGVGTIGYSPLEQYGLGGTDARSDIYALGATLYTLLTRTVPAWSIGRNTGEEQLVPPSRINPAVPAPLEAVIERMMALRAADRYPTATEARAALSQAASLVPPSTRPPARRFCSTCGKAVVTVAGRCHHCGAVFEDAGRIFDTARAPVSAGTTDSPPAVRGDTREVAPPGGVGAPREAPVAPTGGVSTTREAPAPPPLDDVGTPPAPRGGPQPLLLFICALLAGGLLYGARQALRGPLSPSPSRVSTAGTPTPSPTGSPVTEPSVPTRTAEVPSPMPSPVTEPTVTTRTVEGPSPTPQPAEPPRTTQTPSPSGSSEAWREEVPPHPSPQSEYLMPDSARRPLLPGDLAGKDARTLCLIRNEIFARHGRPFEVPEIRAWFQRQPWYKASSSYTDAMLSPLERRNAAFVLRYQQARGLEWP